MPEQKTKQTSIKRQFKFGANAALYTLFVLGILVFIELISAQRHYRVDTTKTGRYTLSPQTKKLLISLNKEIKVTSFFGEMQAEEKEAFKELMRQYVDQSEKVRYENVDPDRSPGMAKRYKVTTYGTIVLEADESEQRISEGSEEKLTNAIIKITRDGKKKVLFLSGHGEREMNAMKEDGYQQAKEAVEQANYETGELTLLPNINALEGTDVLVIAGPQKDLQENEVQVLRNYLKGGGKVFLMLDPFAASGLDSMVMDFGIKLEKDVIIDQISQFFGADLTMPIVSKYQSHPITKDFNLSTFFPLARSVIPVKGSPEGMKVEELLSTSPESWAETDKAMLDEGQTAFDPTQDKKGPVSIGAAVTITLPKKEEEKENEAKPKTGRLVVIGDSDFAANSRINLVGNRDFFLNALSWLAEDADLISIRPKESGSAIPTPLTQSQQQMVFFLPVVVLPLFVIVMGITVYKRRKRMK